MVFSLRVKNTLIQLGRLKTLPMNTIGLMAVTRWHANFATADSCRRIISSEYCS